MQPNNNNNDNNKLIVTVTVICAFSALTLLVGQHEWHLVCKKWRWWRWALVSPDGVVPSRMVGVSAG